MNVFDKEPSYYVSTHAKERFIERTGIKGSAGLVDFIKNGQVISDYDGQRVIQKDGLFFPCERQGRNAYVVKSTLMKNMFAPKNF